MSDFMIILPIILMAVFFILRVPVSYSMICIGVIFLLLIGKNTGMIMDTAMNRLYENSVIVSVPLFIFASNIMNSGKVTEYMYSFAKAIIGKKRGATAYMNILVSLIFSGMTGSAIADVCGTGLMEIDEMKKDGYDMPFSCAMTASTAIVGPIFPPSIGLVIYAMFAEVSVGKLFMGGVLPAILLCGALTVYVGIIAKKRSYPYGHKYTFKEFLKFTWKALPALGTWFILLGGIYSGIVTPTEAGALAAFYAMIIGFFGYKTLNLKSFMGSVKDTVKQTASILALILGANVFSYIVTMTGMANIIADAVLGITNNPYVFLMMINVVFLILGMFFDFNIMMYIFIPLVLPVVNALGINLIHFGVVMMVNMMLGTITPPYGIHCFVVSSLTKTPLQKVFRETIPMAAVMAVILILMTYIPGLVMWIPNMMLGT